MLERPPEGTKQFEITPLSWDYGLRVSGELDLMSARELASALAELDREEEIVLDLGELTFIDSMGMYALLSYARTFDRSRPLVVANPPPAVLRLFELASVKDVPTIRIRIDEDGGPPVSLAEHLLDLTRRPSPPTLDPDSAT
jgi:anti-anti-sigma factor